MRQKSTPDAAQLSFLPVFDHRMRTCQQCGVQYPSRGRGKKFCGEPCQYAAYRTKVTCHCERCGTGFEAKPSQLKRGSARYCSRECRRTPLVQCTCRLCGAQFTRNTTVIRNGRGRFCSKSCRSQATVLWGQRKDTWIESAVYAALDELGIPYERQSPVGKWIADAYIPSRSIVIECQGDFWHVNPDVYPEGSSLSPVQVAMKSRDARKASWYRRNGYQVISLWESDIRKHGARQLLVQALGGS